MEIRKINIRTISEKEYSEIIRFFPETAEKIKNYRPADKKRTLAGRFLLKNMIKEIYGREDFSLVFNENGKPLLDFCFFSISHSEDVAVCAVSDFPVGADIQYMGGFVKRKEYMLFTDAESGYVNQHDSENRFYTLWTMKEAYIKAIGGKIADAAKTEFVTSDFIFKKTYENYKFKTEKQENYVFTVCEKSPEY